MRRPNVVWGRLRMLTPMRIQSWAGLHFRHKLPEVMVMADYGIAGVKIPTIWVLLDSQILLLIFFFIIIGHNATVKPYNIITKYILLPSYTVLKFCTRYFTTVYKTIRKNLANNFCIINF